MHHLQPDYPSDSSPTRDWPDDKQKFCNAPWIFIGFNPKGSSDSEEAKSPTSPLDINTFSEVESSDGHENSLDSQLSSPNGQSETIPIGSRDGFANPTFHIGMEHSESYTCVISHGPLSTTKHIYTHCGMKHEAVQYPVKTQHELQIWDVASNVPQFPAAHFLSTCYLCKRQLSHEKDIYMYRLVMIIIP